MVRSPRQSTLLVRALISFLLLAAGVGAQDTYVIGGPDFSLAPSSLNWAWTEVNFDALRAALTDRTRFGPGGTVETRIELRDLTLIRDDTLNRLDAFVVPYWHERDLTDEQVDVILRFFRAGGDLVLAQDDPLHDKIGERLGFAVDSTSSLLGSEGISPLFRGPFGTADRVTHGGAAAFVHSALVQRRRGRVAAINDGHEITAVHMNRGVYGPNTGALVVLGDVDVITTQADYAAMNDNATFALNTFAFLAERIPVQVVGGPGAGISSGFVSWSGSGFRPFRDALEDPSRFGAGGVVPQRVLTVDLDRIHLATVLQLDVFVTARIADDQIDGAVIDALDEFRDAGRGMLITPDHALHDRVAADLLGVACAGTISSTTMNGGSPLFDGPFGRAVDVGLGNQLGCHFDLAGTAGREVGVNGSDELCAAVFEESKQRGPAVLVGDDTTVGALARYDLMNANAVFSLNAAAWLLEARPYRLGGPSVSLAPTSDRWAWDGDFFRELRESIRDPNFFGATGIAPREVVEETLFDVTPETLATLDAFLVPWWRDTEITPEQVDAIVEFFLNGGDLLVFQDDALHDAVGRALGVPVVASAAFGPVRGTGRLFSGRFGTAGDVETSGARGVLDRAGVLEHGGRVVGENAAGEAMVAVWDRGQYLAGSGSLVMVGDVDMVSRLADFVPFNENGVFAMNLIDASAFPRTPGTIEYYGAGCTGSGGFTPRLRVRGHPGLGHSIVLDLLDTVLPAIGSRASRARSRSPPA